MRRRQDRVWISAGFLLAVIGSCSLCTYESPRPAAISGARHLLQARTETLLPLDDSEDGNPYPKVFFTREDMENGAVLLCIAGIVYLFFALAIVCDDYFVPALEVIIDKLDLSEDVAGATFMAAGGSAPELFTSIMGVFVAKSNVGFGTIVGSAVFNILFVIGICSVATYSIAPNGLELTWWPLFRDSIFYSVDLAMLTLFFLDHKIEWYESLALLFGYLFYVLFMSINQRAQKRAWEVVGGLKWNDLAAKLVEEEELQRKGEGSGTEEEEDDDDDDDDEEEDIWVPKCPEGSLWEKLKFVILFPINLALTYTVPNCKKEKERKYYVVAFIFSIVWIAFFAYFMVWWAEITGRTLGIPSEVLGFTILAAGTSVPDLITSVLVARKGFGDMAVSSSIGSNIFDITFGLPLPWLLKSISNGGEAVTVESKSLGASVIMLFVMLFTTVASIAFFGWRLSAKLGAICFVLYIIFVSMALLIEYGVIEANV